jgi:prophage regulatory protein
MNELTRGETSPARFIRFGQLKSEKGIPFSRVHIDRLEKIGAFPRRFRLGKNTVAWREDEINEWALARLAERGS